MGGAIMTQYKWGGALFANARDMADAIAFNWMTAGGLNSSELIDSFLQNQTPEELAVECLNDWSCPLPLEEKKEIIESFIRFSVNRPDKIEARGE